MPYLDSMGQLVSTQEEIEQKNCISYLNAQNNFLQGGLTQATQTINELQSQNMFLRGKLMDRNIFEQQHQFTTNINGDIYVLKFYDNKKHIKYIGNIQITAINIIHFLSENKTYYQVSYKSCKDTEYKSTLISEKEFNDRKLANHFPNCQYDSKDKSILNDYLYREIKKLTNVSICYIPALSGFYRDSNGNISFYSLPEKIPSDFLDILPQCIQKRKLVMFDDVNIREINNKYINHYRNSTFTLLILCRLIGLMSSILKDIGISFPKIIILSGDNPHLNDICACFLQIYNRPSFKVNSLDCSETQLHKLLAEANDEIIIFCDDRLFNNEKRQMNALKYLWGDLKNTNIKDDNKPDSSHLIAIISNAAAALLPAEDTFRINIPKDFGSDLDLTALSQDFEKIDSKIIQNICNNYKDITDYFEYAVSETKKINFEKLSPENVQAYAVLDSMFNFYFNILNFEPSDDDYKFNLFIIKALESSGNEYKDRDCTITNLFNNVLNTAIHKEKISIIKYGKEMNYEEGKNIAILKNIKEGEVLLLDKPIMKNIILPAMKELTDRFSVLIDALKTKKILYITNDRTRCSSNTYCEGERNSIYDFFAVYAEKVLDNSIYNMLKCPIDNRYFSEIDINNDFVPLLKDFNGRIACQQINNNRENRHLFITGKSGSGKSTALINLTASYCEAGELSIIFDKNDSFKKEDCERLLSEKFVRDNIQFYDTEKYGFPVDPLCPFTIENKKYLGDILSAPFPKISSSAKISVYEMLDKYMKKMGEKSNACEMFLSENKTWVKGNSQITMMNKLSVLFENLYEKIFPFTGWDKLIEALNGKKIAIISMPNVGEYVNQIIDILIASFLVWRMKNSNNGHINIFIDEIQSQNLSDEGAIVRLLKEGRKYDLSLNYATQEYSSDHKDVCRIARQANTKIFLRQDISSCMLVGKELGLKPKECDILKSFKDYKCMVTGRFYNYEERLTEETVLHGMIYRRIV